MTPKEKARELYEKFIFPCWECDEFAKAKECALIAVDEIYIELTEEISPSVHGFRHKYWQDVKLEIEKL